MFQPLTKCGPAPLKAIKEGEVYIGYDAAFIFAEVNADRMTWIVKKVGKSEIVHSLGKRESSTVGINISTKAVGSFDRHVVTNEYKHG